MGRRAFYLLLVWLICGYASLALGADQGGINSGETRSSTIGPPSYLDTWTFDGQAGDRVLINAVTTSGNLVTQIILYPPGGLPKEADSFPSNRLDHQLQHSGIYTIVIQDTALSRTGDYNITFLKLPGTVSYPGDADGGPIASGQTLSATINVASDMDAFQFYGQAGDRVLINAVTTSGNLITQILLYPPGSLPKEADSFPSNKLDYQLQNTGLYTIVIQDTAVSRTGGYNLTFLKLPGAVSYPGDPDGGAIASGQTLGASINVPSDLDAFQFYGQAGERVLINAVTTSGSLITQILLYPPGGLAKEADSFPNNHLDHQLQNSGLYTIVIQDTALSRTGKYNISLSKIPATQVPGIYNPYPANGASIYNINGAFRWSGVSGATGYDLYWGEGVTQPLQKIGSDLSLPSMAFPALTRGKIYYWQVVAHTAQGDVSGPVCWFFVSTRLSPGLPWLHLLLLQ